MLILVLAYQLTTHDTSSRHQLYWIAGIIVSLTLVSKGSSFIVYFDGYLNQSNALQALLLGTFLGLGICLSVAVLLYLGAKWLKQKLGLWATWFLVFIYGVGQLVNAIPLLVQVDLMNASAVVWSSEALVSNKYELGHLLKVLLGYQATPTMTQVTVYMVALLLPLPIFYWLKQSAASHLGDK